MVVRNVRRLKLCCVVEVAICYAKHSVAAKKRGPHCLLLVGGMDPCLKVPGPDFRRQESLLVFLNLLRELAKLLSFARDLLSLAIVQSPETSRWARPKPGPQIRLPCHARAELPSRIDIHIPVLLHCDPYALWLGGYIRLAQPK